MRSLWRWLRWGRSWRLRSLMVGQKVRARGKTYRVVAELRGKRSVPLLWPVD